MTLNCRGGGLWLVTCVCEFQLGACHSRARCWSQINVGVLSDLSLWKCIKNGRVCVYLHIHTHTCFDTCVWIYIHVYTTTSGVYIHSPPFSLFFFLTDKRQTLSVTRFSSLVFCLFTLITTIIIRLFYNVKCFFFVHGAFFFFFSP